MQRETDIFWYETLPQFIWNGLKETEKKTLPEYPISDLDLKQLSNMMVAEG